MLSSTSGRSSDGEVDLPSRDDEASEKTGDSATKGVGPCTALPLPPIWKESRSFWKAGSYDVAVSDPQPCFQGQLEHARIHPKFLHSNATSHKWAFGAMAELLDNAVDEVYNGATFVKVDKLLCKDNSSALLFQDDGGGMNPEGMRRCMSLGYSMKKTGTTIGQYGNGFKTSTMRLGADAIVFTRNICGNHATQTIGLLSYTFLRKTGQDDIIVPMVDFEMLENRPEPLIYSTRDDWNNSLKTILSWSPFSVEEELMLQFEDIGPHGTKVIIYNLWLNDDGFLELDFDYDDEDIRLSDDGNSCQKYHKVLAESHVSYCYRYSLRAYASILYLQKFSNFHIILRGKAVEQLSIVDNLKFPKVVSYRPQLGANSKDIVVEMTIGFLKEAPMLKAHGVNIYHKNRLIMPFLSVVPFGSSNGRGVVGVLEANFIEPVHDKQDFERTSLFIRLESKLRQMITEYRRCNLHLIERSAVNLRPSRQEDLFCQTSVVSLAANASPSRDGDHCEAIRNYTRDTDLPHRSHGPVQQPSVPANSEADRSGHAVIDKICEENLQLFMRCDMYRKEEAKLKQTVENLEIELKEAKRKYSHLAWKVELHKSRMRS